MKSLEIRKTLSSFAYTSTTTHVITFCPKCLLVQATEAMRHGEESGNSSYGSVATLGNRLAGDGVAWREISLKLNLCTEWEENKNLLAAPALPPAVFVQR
jgi:hypothetical protein